MSTAPRLVAPEPTFAELFTPKGYHAKPNVRHVLVGMGLKPPVVRYAPSVADARMAARHHEEVEA